jgi:hypothetical protein
MTDLLLLSVAELLVWLESHAAIAAGVVAALLVPGLICCWAARRGAVVSRQALTRIDQRLTQICSAVELLTDTTESALRTAFGEIERLSQENATAAAHRAGLPIRVKKAARNGRTAREIAQAEGVSEGEVRLRLRLQGDESEDASELPVLQ